MSHFTESLERPASETSPENQARVFVNDWARRKIRGFEGTIDEVGEYLSKIYPTARSISEQVVADYHGRFLIELIQNANDVHARPAPARRGQRPCGLSGSPASRQSAGRKRR